MGIIEKIAANLDHNHSYCSGSCSMSINLEFRTGLWFTAKMQKELVAEVKKRLRNDLLSVYIVPFQGDPQAVRFYLNIDGYHGKDNLVSQLLKDLKVACGDDGK